MKSKNNFEDVNGQYKLYRNRTMVSRYNKICHCLFSGASQFLLSPAYVRYRSVSFPGLFAALYLRSKTASIMLGVEWRMRIAFFA